VVRFLIILFSIILYGSNAFCQEELLSGLSFSSHEVIQDKRTSLNLTPYRASNFPKGFSMEMEANFRNGDGLYGYVFRIIGEGNTNIDLVSNLASSSSNFWLVYKDKILCSYKWSDIPKGGFDRWIKIRVDMNTTNSKLSISFNGNKQEREVPDIGRLKNYNIEFGACGNSSFNTSDVCPMSLKNIRIFDANNKLIQYWKLSKHSQSKVYDETNHAEALAENPKWIIDKHVKWQKIKDFKINDLIGITKDEENGRIFFVNHHAVYVMSTNSFKVDTIKFAGGEPYFELGNQIIYNKFTNELWSYKFFKNGICKFSFITRKWSSHEALEVSKIDYWHHNKFISPTDSSLVTLFGYGHHIYKSIVNRFNIKSKSWVNIDRSEQIQPRYLSGTGFLNNQEMLVFGGFGSKTGRQELSPEIYYDLYLLNLKNYSFKKLWTLDTPLAHFVPCEALVPDQQSGNFYTLVYNSGKYATFLRLAKFGIKKNDYQFYNDSIPYSFLDIESWSSLFLDKKTSQLIAITSHNSDVSLYSIAYPPLVLGDAYQSVPIKWNWYVWAVLCLLVGGMTFAVIILFGKRRSISKTEDQYEQVYHPNIVPIEPVERKTSSSVYLMGGIQIFDSKGLNITGAFSPTLKHLFLYIFLNTVKNGKGISSTKLDEVLWYDKIGDSARNNRNVNISKLRSVLEEVGGMELANENSFWKIKMDETIFCDYTVVLHILHKSKSKSLTESEIHELISLLSFGEFMPNIQNEWMDGFRALFANEIIDGLSSLFKDKVVKNNSSLYYHLVECFLIYDPLNDEAFAMKCSVLYHQGKKASAKKMYDSFCREYKKVLGIKYNVSFKDIIK